MGFTLTILIPVVLLAYAIWLVARMVRGRRRGESICGYGGCTGCPMAEGCQLVKKREQDARAAGDGEKGEEE